MAIFRVLRQANCCSHAKFTIDANHVIKKDRPQIPVIEDSCISGRLPYCVYARAPQLPLPNALTYSIATQLQGKTNVAIGPDSLGAITRSAKKGIKKTTPTAKPETTRNEGGIASIDSNFHIETIPTIMLAKQRINKPEPTF